MEVKITDDQVVTMHKETILRALGVAENRIGFKLQEPTTKEFQLFLTHIGYNGEFKANKFNKLAVLGLWTILMHLILRALSDNHGGLDTMTKDWIYFVYNTFTGKPNVVDLPEVIWQDFRKFTDKNKSNKIPSPRFWALTLQ